MTEVKALFPIGKTQWRKWDNAQRTAFNEAREAGVPYNDAIQAANQTQPAKKRSFLDKIGDAVEDVAEVAATVSGVATTATSVVSVAKAVAKTAKPAGRAKKGK